MRRDWGTGRWGERNVPLISANGKPPRLDGKSASLFAQFAHESRHENLAIAKDGTSGYPQTSGNEDRMSRFMFLARLIRSPLMSKLSHLDRCGGLFRYN